LHPRQRNLYCIFVNNGLLRKNEFQSVLDHNVEILKCKKATLLNVSADALRELLILVLKRKAIGNAFIEVFDAESQLIEDVTYSTKEQYIQM
jgi:GMP synthase (glutamine-hydrolysing)